MLKNFTRYACIRVYLLQKGTHTFAISFECLPDFCKEVDMQMILQMSGCLELQQICKHSTFSTCDFMFMQHTSHYDKVSLNLKTCKSINLQAIHIYMDSLIVFKKR